MSRKRAEGQIDVEEVLDAKAKMVSKRKHAKKHGAPSAIAAAGDNASQDALQAGSRGRALTVTKDINNVEDEGNVVGVAPTPAELPIAEYHDASEDTNAASTTAATTPGTSATASGTTSGIETPASETSGGTKRKRDEGDDEVDLVLIYRRMLSEVVGVIVSRPL